jgi:hypothetical protein
MNDHNALCGHNLIAMFFNEGVKIGVFREFGCGQDGVESFLVKIVIPDLMTIVPQRRDDNFRNGVIETSLARVSENDRYVHDLPLLEQEYACKSVFV